VLSAHGLVGCAHGLKELGGLAHGLDECAHSLDGAHCCFILVQFVDFLLLLQ
jgi:hypothetical protein